MTTEKRRETQPYGAVTRSPSSIRTEGVAGVLEHVRKDAEEAMRKRLLERSKSVDLYTEVEIDHLSRLAGTIAKNAAANGVAESYQLGVNRSVQNEEYEATTVRATLNPTKP